MKDVKKETIETYNVHIDFFTNRFEALMDPKKRIEFQEFMDLLKGNRVLDVGCGPGHHSLFFKEHGLKVLAVDLSEKMIEKCKERGLDAQVMDIENLKFSNKSFDGIWANSSLLHVSKEKIPLVIEKMYAMLSDEGILYVCVKKGKGEGLVEDKKLGAKRFFSFWNKKDFIKLFRAKFELIDAKDVKLENMEFIEVFFRKLPSN